MFPVERKGEARAQHGQAVLEQIKDLCDMSKWSFLEHLAAGMEAKSTDLEGSPAWFEAGLQKMQNSGIKVHHCYFEILLSRTAASAWSAHSPQKVTTAGAPSSLLS